MLDFSHNALISKSTAIIALPGFKDFPFNVNDIQNIYQTAEDTKPKNHGDWKYWDSCKNNENFS